MAVRTRRARAAGGRPHQITVWLSDEELAAITDGAERSGMAAGAWLGQVGVAAAEVGPAPRVGSAGQRAQVVVAELVAVQNQLRDTKRILRNVGGNLNDVARAANSTGQLAEETDAVARLVARVVASVEASVRQVSGQTSAVMADYRTVSTRAARAVARRERS